MGASLTTEQLGEFRLICDDKFDDRELRHMHRLFHRAAPQGKMGPSEFKRYVEGLGVFQAGAEHETYDQLFRGFDVDQDKQVSFKDYLRYHRAVVHGGADLPGVIHAICDAEATGFVTVEGLAKVITNSIRWTGEQDPESALVAQVVAQTATNIVHVCDADKDGRVSRDELCDAATRHPEVLEKLKQAVGIS